MWCHGTRIVCATTVLCCVRLHAAESGMAPDLRRLRAAVPGVAFVDAIAAQAPDLPPNLELRYTSPARADSAQLILRPVLRNSGETTAHLDQVVLFSASLPRPNGDGPFRRCPSFAADDTWYESPYWDAGNWARVGRNWQHPADANPTVRTFACPDDGEVAVTGRVFKLHRDGDGVDVAIRHNTRLVWSAELEGNDGEGIGTDLKLTVRKGDRIRFVVGKRHRIFCDTTGWDPVITYPDGRRFIASAGFSAEQGKNGWFYDTQNGDPDAAVHPPAPAFPPVRQLGSNLMIRRVSRADSSRSHLPVFAVSAQDDSGGLALAVDDGDGCELRMTPRADGTVLDLVRHGRIDLAPDAETELPAVEVSAYEGRWIAGFATRSSHLSDLDRAIADAVDAYGREMPELDLFLLTQAEWLREDRIDGSDTSLRGAIENHLARTEAMVRGLRTSGTVPGILARSTRLREALSRDKPTVAQLESLYVRTRLLKRDVLLNHPLMNFDQLLFGKRRLCRWSHLVMQYFGFRARRGGGIYVLDEPGRSTRVRDVVADQLPPGSFLEPRLSYDGKRVVFSYVECGDKEIDYRTLVQNEQGEDVGYYHVYEIGVDGTGLRKLTSGPYDDVMPNYLPDGGIVFCSSRRRAYSRCFGATYSKRWHSYTVHRMDADGANMQILSHNDVSEWFPVVGNTGHVLFARWDYIDRHAVLHQNLWAMRPDGTNQMALWGNGAPKPHCTFQIQPVPNSSKIAFIASAHHALTGGPVCLVDPNVDANSLDAVTRITPQPFPEAEGFTLPDYYEYVWPLSEQLFLVGYSDQDLRSQGRSYDDPTPDNALGIYVLDSAGNRELIYRDPALNSSTPVPLRARPRPPVLNTPMPDSDTAMAEVIMTDVQQGLGNIRPGTIKELRIVQVFPKTTPWANGPRVGFAGEENARAVLGTVPVEADGSARFLVPPKKLLLFQALDGNGDAYQTMRSTTVFQPGERTSCIGCHESRKAAPPRKPVLAVRKPPSRLVAGPFDGKPFSYMTVVQPILDKHCVSCHAGDKPKKDIDLTGTPRNGFAESYWSLCGEPTAFDGHKTNPENARAALVPRFGQRNPVDVTAPGGLYGARGSRLMALLRKGHEKVQLDDAELRRIAMWIDLNAVFYGAYLEERRGQQLAGKDIAMPEIQ